MSSREFIALLSDLPEESAFRERAERAQRLVEVDGDLRLYSALAALPAGAVIDAEFVDWTHDRKIAARTAQELSCLRADGRGYQPSIDGLNEPLAVALRARIKRQRDDQAQRSRSSLRDAIERGKHRKG